MLLNRLVRTAWITCLLIVLCSGVSRAELVWFDGAHSPENAPPGKLLSDNHNYWGEVVLTGMTSRVGESESPLLFDGSPERGVDMNPERPLEVVLDFRRDSTFAEVDLCTTKNVRLALAVKLRENEETPWRQVADHDPAASVPARLLRIKLDEDVKGRFIGLTIRAQGTAQLSEVLVWGDAEVSVETPEVYEPVAPAAALQGNSFETVPGVSKTAASDMSTFLWLRDIGDAATGPAIWSHVAAWGPVTDKPIQPSADTVNLPVQLLLARNETECAALALKSTDMAASRDVEVSLGAFKDAAGRPAAGVTATLGVFGVIPSRNYGSNIGPIFEADNMLGESLMRKYLLNGAGIADFPKITLSPAGAAILWLSVSTEDAKPGIYQADLRVHGGDPVPLRVEVVDVTLPSGPFALVQPWNSPLSMFPFVYSDRLEREIDYQLTCGISSFYRPKPGSADALARKMATERGMKIVHEERIVPDHYFSAVAHAMKAEDFSDADRKAIADRLREVVQRNKELGMTYDDWYGVTSDEPGPNIAAVARMHEIIRDVDPRVKIWCNPAFWVDWPNGGFAPDDIVAPALEGWYDRLVDVSAPIGLILDPESYPKSFPHFTSPRWVNMFYHVSTHHAKSEHYPETTLYRKMAWDAFAMDMNGWGFWRYHGPAGNPWNDFDAGLDYLMVYPVPRGPVATRQSESLREGWEDWRLLNLLNHRRMQSELNSLLKDLAVGAPTETLRRRALRALAQQPPSAEKRMP